MPQRNIKCSVRLRIKPHLNRLLVWELALALALECKVVINCPLDVLGHRAWQPDAAVAANGQCDLHQHAREVHCAQGANGLEAVADLFQSGKCAVPPIKSTDVRVDFLELA